MSPCCSASVCVSGWSSKITQRITLGDNALLSVVQYAGQLEEVGSWEGGVSDGCSECRLKQSPSWACSTVAPDPSQVCNWPSWDRPWEGLMSLRSNSGSLEVWSGDVSQSGSKTTPVLVSLSFTGGKNHKLLEWFSFRISGCFNPQACLNSRDLELPPEVEGWGLPHALSSLSLNCGTRTLKFERQLFPLSNSMEGKSTILGWHVGFLSWKSS